MSSDERFIARVISRRTTMVVTTIPAVSQCGWPVAIKPGVTYGATDDYSYNVVENPVSVHDFHATIMHLLGIDHEKLTYKFQGRHFRLTDVLGHVVKDILA